MGNIKTVPEDSKMSSAVGCVPARPYTKTSQIQFMDYLSVSSDNNGLLLNGHYLPEEVLTNVLSFLDADDLLKASLVCKRWYNFVRSNSLWFTKYKRHYKGRPKHLPWFCYYMLFSEDFFNVNLIKNGNGEEKFNHWVINKNYGDQFIVEKEPVGADPLPEDVEEFHGAKSCFATSYYECDKEQVICFTDRPLARYILDNFTPTIYASEWVAGRFDCACIYTLTCRLCPKPYVPFGKRFRSFDRWDTSGDESDDLGIEEDLHSTAERERYRQARELEKTMEPLKSEEKQFKVDQWKGKDWNKVELSITSYPKGVEKIVFRHEGHDLQFWKGHYGPKMAGGVLKILFESINEEEE